MTPTLREELDRKVYDTADWLVNGLDKGRFTNEQFSMGMNTLFSTVAGLANEDFIHIVTEAQKQCAYVNVEVKRHFHSPDSDEIRTARWVPGEAKLMVTLRTCGEVTYGKSVEYASPAGARDMLDKFSDAMLKKGWYEL